jgi:serine protease Do
MRVWGVSAAILALCLSSPVLARGAPDGFADLAEQLLPAVVNVSSTQTIAAGKEAPEDEETPFEQFFHDYMNRHNHGDNHGDAGPDDDDGDNGDNGSGNNGGDNGPHHTQSLGSGFIIDPSGIIVTNNHVIDGADEISVILQDNTTLKARVLGHDDRTDLAVLKVESKNPLPFVHFGDSDKSRVGDWVVAIGNPFGLGGTVTAGIVSARGRDIQQGPYDDFIQTDAPINRGNSGGPLFNLAGEVVGINTAIYSPSGGSIGIGFSIPSSEARLIVEQLRQYGHTRRGWLGVRIQQVTPDIADTLGLANSDGALVAGVTSGGPADRAHLQNGDVIVAFDGKKIEAMHNLPRIVAQTAVGRDVPVKIWRQGHEILLDAVVTEMPEDSAPAVKLAAKPAPDKSVLVQNLGIKLAPMSEALKHKYKLDPAQKGVVIVDVAPDSVAADRGMRAGNVIMEVQQHAVAMPGDVLARLRALRAAGKKSALLLLAGPDGFNYVPVPLDGDAK